MSSDVLPRVRRALASARLPRPAAAPEAALPVFADDLAAFAGALEGLGGRLLTPPSADEARAVVVEIVRACAGPAIAWAPEELPIGGLSEALREAGVPLEDAAVPAEAAGRAARLAELGRARVGITGTLAAIAETGSVVLASGPGRPRLAWLLPPRRVALISRRRIYPTLEAFFADHPDVCSGRAEVAFVSGPSRSADIELTLTRGVHGPRELDVVVLP